MYRGLLSVNIDKQVQLIMSTFTNFDYDLARTFFEKMSERKMFELQLKKCPWQNGKMSIYNYHSVVTAT